MKAWWTAQELALQALPGLPTTKRKINEVAAQQGWASRTNAILAELAEIDPDLERRVAAALDRMEQVEEAGRMTLALFEAAAREIRDAITARRFNAKPVLVVIQGGRTTQPHHQIGA